MLIDTLRARAQLLVSTREFFQSRNVLEVETPVLSQAGVCEPYLRNLSTDISGHRYFLQTSPEFAMKRLLCAGSGSIYQISKAFRDDEQGSIHNPEFTMLEWYRVGFDYHQLMDEVQALASDLLGITDFAKITYQQAFDETLGIDPERATYSELENLAGAVTGQTSKNDLLDLIMSDKVLPKLPKAVFVYDYPANQAAMAKIRGDVAERFELVIDGVELANGYSELTDADEQEQRFINENKQRETLGLEPMAIDQNFLAAMQQGLPECAGVALGFDRLLMLASNKTSLADVLPFPIEKA